VAVQLNTTGTVTPLTSVDVRSQVSSTIRQVHFKEGEFVKAGQLLFTLDARTDEANTAKARAQQAKDAASLSDAQRQLARAKQLLAQNFVSQGAVETAQALVDTAAATVAADKAAVDASQVALSYARIVAPNSGRAGQVTVFAGSAVQASLTPLVTITQLDPIGVVFSIPQRNLNDALEALKAGGAAVNATLADGGGRFKGRLKFVDNLVDPNSGAVKVKAVFDNPKNLLWPGVFVDVLQTVSTLKDAVVIPQAAIIQSQRGATVYVVTEGKAVLRPVKLVYAEGGDAAVTGVAPGESVVQEGKENLRPNANVLERAREPSRAASGAEKPAQP
jgi:RND family efflux transporter MFP subunit